MRRRIERLERQLSGGGTICRRCGRPHIPAGWCWGADDPEALAVTHLLVRRLAAAMHAPELGEYWGEAHAECPYCRCADCCGETWGPLDEQAARIREERMQPMP